MKRGITLLILLLFIQSYGQDVFSTDWMLTELYIDGVSYSPPSNSEVPQVIASFSIDNPDYFESGVCNAMYAVVIVEENPETLTFPDGMLITLIDCNDPDNAIFEGLYWYSFFESYINDPFSYSIAIIDGGGTYPDGLALSITNSNGDSAYYLDTILSVSDNSLSEITLFPNPVEDAFQLNSTLISDNLSLSIYDVTGKKVFIQYGYQIENSVDIQNLKSGIYFVSIIDEGGNTSVKRLIKN